MKIYNIEATDLFSGEANYSWVRRLDGVVAKSEQGALQIFLRHHSWNGFRKYQDMGHCIEYRNGLTTVFVTQAEPSWTN
jgi:hypothetical protein